MSEEVVVEAPQETVEAPAENEVVQKPEGEAEQATAEKPEADKAPEKTDEQPEKKGQARFERRLAAAHRRAAEEKARADLLERQIEELKPKPVVLDGEPKLEQFDDIEKYAQAKAEFAKQQAIKDHTAKQQADAQKRYVDSLRSSWDEKVSAAEGKYDDFEDVVGRELPINPLTVAIMEAENSADIAYFLAKNRKEAERIVSLPTTAQLREIGKLEAKLLAEPPKPKTPSKAPPPIEPVQGKTGASNELPSDSDDIKTWMRKENARMKKLAGA